MAKWNDTANENQSNQKWFHFICDVLRTRSMLQVKKTLWEIGWAASILYTFLCFKITSLQSCYIVERKYLRKKIEKFALHDERIFVSLFEQNVQRVQTLAYDKYLTSISKQLFYHVFVNSQEKNWQKEFASCRFWDNIDIVNFNFSLSTKSIACLVCLLVKVLVLTHQKKVLKNYINNSTGKI